MKKIFLFALVFSFAFFHIQAHEHCLVGNYSIYGNYPDSEEYYTAAGTIEREGENYYVTWNWLDGTFDYGIGILIDDHLSISYQFSDDCEEYGVEVLKIKDERLQGPWTNIGYYNQGYETWHKVFE